MSNAAAVGAPTSTAIWVAIAGVWYRCVTVATMTQPIWAGSMPDVVQRVLGGVHRHHQDGLVVARPSAVP